MSAHSPIDGLRWLSPLSDAEGAAVFGVTGREELLAGITSLRFGRSSRLRSTRRRRLVLAVAVLALAVTATAATWAIVASAPARETTSVQCLIGSSDAIIPSSSGDPAADCAADWRREFGTAPPALQAYDNGLGGVTVIPRSQTPPAGWQPLQSQDVALIELQDSLDDYISGLNSSCLDAAGATRLAEAKLAQFGFSGWTVGLRDPNSAGQAGMCTDSDIVDPGTQTVTLIASEASTAPGTVKQLADRLRSLAQSCESLPAAVASVRTAATSVGLSASEYELDSTADGSLRCASIYETVGGTIFLTLRGPSG